MSPSLGVVILLGVVAQWLQRSSCGARSRAARAPTPAALAPLCAGAQQRLVAALREYRMLHMRGMGPGIGVPGMGSSLSPNSLVLPERLKSLPLLVLGAWARGVPLLRCGVCLRPHTSALASSHVSPVHGRPLDPAARPHLQAWLRRPRCAAAGAT